MLVVIATIVAMNLSAAEVIVEEFYTDITELVVASGNTKHIVGILQ